ncbi:MAG TPA: ornithine cyclodeaminase family protein [Terracidiphilus sp.]|nr:ornithine cyclodeaminase family protein [Terracidiphilus sp.]
MLFHIFSPGREFALLSGRLSAPACKLAADARYTLMLSMYIAEEEVRSLLTYEALIPAMREALIDYSAGRVEQPPRMVLRVNPQPGDRDMGASAEAAGNGWFAVMPVIYRDVMGVKTVTFFPGNADLDPNLGLHTHLAVIELLSRETGEPLALMDGRLITEMRTAAVSAVSLDALAAPDVTSLGILGAGVQARSHLEALRRVRPGLRDVRIWSRNPANAERLAAEAKGPGFPVSHPLRKEREEGGARGDIRATSIEEAAAADVVLTVTASPTPVLQGRWLQPDALVLAVGAVGAQLRELDDEAVQTSWVVAESRQGVEREAGDVVLSGARVEAEIGEILAAAAFPVPRGRRILFKSVGMAIEDLVAARQVWKSRV